jgi:hypothetical protein
MRFVPSSRLLVVLLLVTGGAALAQRRQIKEFQPDLEMTQEQRDEARARPKYNINSYGRDVSVKTEPIPWKAIGLAGIAFLVAAPFAIRAFMGTTKEMASANVFGVASSRAGEGEGEE